MQIRSTGKPRQERSVLDRIPTPVAAPSKHVVAPPRTKHDAKREETPGKQGPAPGLNKPAFADSARDQRGNCERKRNGESDIPEVEHGGMNGHEHIILEQWVRARAVDETGWQLDADERVSRSEHKRKEEGRNQQHDNQRPGH